MQEYGFGQVRGAPVVNEEALVSEPPERGGSPLAAVGPVLWNAVCQLLAHVVYQEIGIGTYRFVLQRLHLHQLHLRSRAVRVGEKDLVSGLHLRDMTDSTLQ